MAVGDFVILSFSVLIVSFVTSIIIGSLIEKPLNRITEEVLFGNEEQKSDSTFQSNIKIGSGQTISTIITKSNGSSKNSSNFF